ncbi:MAG: NAD-dependent epimerase/dehydratase family protein [Deltaproteobacteria bacterium]|jgi:nucleoside-diphosphate-sugar epimerase|nr:NAD-dependent epimerase/dehydratase family protein [Deltaproteobacteria bacterium]
MLVLVTGAGGFVGSHVVRQLLDQGHEVRAMARRRISPDWAGKVELRQGDLADMESLRAAVAGADAVIHTAARSGIWGHLAEYMENNVMGTNRIMEAARQAGVKHFIHTSSYSVVHSSDSQEGVDENKPYSLDVDAPYAYSKMLAERLVLTANNPAFRTVVLRPHLVWGPGDPNIIPRLVERARKGRLVLFSGGPYMVDATYVDNVAKAHALALEKLAAGASIGGEAFFIGQDEPQDVNVFINKLLEAVKAPPAKRRVSKKLGRAAAKTIEGVWKIFDFMKEPPTTVFAASQMSASHWSNLQKAKNLLGYVPEVSVEEGLRRLAQAAENGYAQPGKG